ncbi:biotin--[acetyl-CoA-carboxylase] ligase [Sphingomonas oligophenolica]|uniref:biotin--[biotin carboxyl-carrier protein] ligase n=1 Tax=Sphingomonas oligophenolica TaxID=301154 RepID=A0A502CLV4_9SPHN|nr:biotin--[acetyl-CoA-carboxylase] ligase [Sphingomonas oligophenolica]TPG12681.1 biotin--[acetyl-CoA-carboxylase] ligase [Sphingomonas oligophenolica]
MRTVAETGSTNADMLELARSGVAEGLWLRAERQTLGRGRQGRAWESPIGNCYATNLVRLRPTDPPAATLALVAAVALAEAVSVYTRRPSPRLKWPNDLLIDGAKLSGILLERADDAVVIGIGVNLAHHPDLAERPTTSLAAHGVVVAPENFIDTLADSVARWLSRWRSEVLAPVRQRWLDLAHPIGTALTVRLPDGTAIDGLFDGLDSDGALILRLADATRRVIHAADVFLL